MELDDDDGPKKTPRAVVIRRALVFALAVACGVTLVYTRWLAKKSNLAGPCSYDMHCRADAPRCMKPSADEEGVCSRPCDVDGGDCAEGIRCIKVGLDEYDDRGRPMEGGFCVPQALLDARKKKKDAGAPPAQASTSWVDVPKVPGQLEGEIVMKRERRGAASEATYLVKGTLLRPKDAGSSRTLVDTSSMRVFVVDDTKKTVAGAALGSAPDEVQVDKTGQKDRVADRECEVWKLQVGKTTYEACVVSGGAFVDPSSRSVPAWGRELAARAMFPLRVVTRDKAGKETSRVEVVKIEARPLDDALFEVPKSYRNLAGR
ncbi:MAG: DUF4412 domain-containing protein [Myxococcales bacterium]|nr:DUF4412 domain-containing protein [Myxococcales bacterium]